MTTNISEVFNYVLKGIREKSVLVILEYTFHKCNSYFISRWRLAVDFQLGSEVGGKTARVHLREA